MLNKEGDLLNKRVGLLQPVIIFQYSWLLPVKQQV